MPQELTGRRLPVGADGSFGLPQEPGEYVGPVMVDGRLRVFFLLPNSQDEGAPGGQRSVHHVASPPHVFRECSDGSLEIRQSIGAAPFWHGWLNCGHRWALERDP